MRSSIEVSTAVPGANPNMRSNAGIRHADHVVDVDDHHAFVQQLEHARLGLAQVLRRLAVGDLGDVDHRAGDAARRTHRADARIEACGRRIACPMLASCRSTDSPVLEHLRERREDACAVFGLRDFVERAGR